MQPPSDAGHEIGGSIFQLRGLGNGAWAGKWQEPSSHASSRTLTAVTAPSCSVCVCVCVCVCAFQLHNCISYEYIVVKRSGDLLITEA